MVDRIILNTIYMNVNETLSKIDSIFEQMSTPVSSIPTEPVASTMMTQVSGKLATIWDSDGRFHKYREMSNEQLAQHVKVDKVVKNINNVKSQMSKVQTVDPTTNKSAGVDDHTCAIVSRMGEILNTTDVRKIASVFSDISRICVNVAMMYKDEKTRVKELLNALNQMAAHHKIDQKKLNALIALVQDNDDPTIKNFGTFFEDFATKHSEFQKGR